MWKTRTKVGWGLLMLGAVLMALLAARYYTFDPDVFFDRQRAVFEDKTGWLIVHISGMMFAILAGPLQFLRPLREKHFHFHRALGKIYILGALVGAVGGIYMSRFSASGTASHVGFAALGVGVLITTITAYRRIRSGNVQSHREWMTRSYALIFAAVTLRIEAPFLESAFGEYDGYAAVAWVCWIPNLIFAEWLIRARLRRRIEPTRGNDRPLIPAQRAHPRARIVIETKSQS
jgi:uncharacterized membrane protein